MDSKRIDISSINRSAISRATGIDLAHISRIFSGQRRPSLEYAVKIADYLNITVGDFCVLIGVNVSTRERERDATLH